MGMPGQMDHEPVAQLICLQPENVLDLWHVARPMLVRAYEAADEFLPQDLLDRLTSGKGRLWLVLDRDRKIVAVMTTRLERRPSGLACVMVACGGDELPLWRRFHFQIEQYAKSEGCTKVTLTGRSGWSRLLEGYKATSITLEKGI